MDEASPRDGGSASTAVPGVPRVRDYGLDGPETRRAIDRGLANARWFQPVIDPTVLRALQARTNARAAADQALWLALVIGAGTVAVASAWSWWSIPAFIVYGALYAGAADSRWHECGHGTAFRSATANDAVYHLASFMLLRGPTVWRWSHYRHHTDSIIVGRDAEIAFPRPANVWRSAIGFTGYWVPGTMLWRLVRHAGGRLDDDALAVVPAHEHRRVVWEARVFVAIVAATSAGAVATGSAIPILLVGGPTVYGAWLMIFFGITQHAGLREDVLDHRLNSRTVYMNPLFRFLYLNMNYHVEHHLLPSVPYRNLPALHAQIADQLAPPKPTMVAAYREIWSTLWRQQRDPDHELPIDLPPEPTSAAASAERRLIEVGETSWVRAPGGREHAVDLGAVESLGPGEIREVEIDGEPYVLCRPDPGGSDPGAGATITLLDGVCTHQQVRLCQGTMVGGTIECPKHNARFDVYTGRAVRRPATTDLGVHRVEVVHGRLIASVGAQSGSPGR